MKGTYLPPVKTIVTAAEAVEGFREACKTLWKTDKPETIATLAAQSALESGRWHAMWNGNPSNIKHELSRVGSYTCIVLNEVLSRNGKRVLVWFDPVLGELVKKGGPARYVDALHALPPGHPQTRMRAYATFADGVADKLRFLLRSRYTACRVAALLGDPSLYAMRCGEAGYYTADRGPYTRSVVSLYKWLLPIARDRAPEPKPLPPPIEDQLCHDMSACLRVPKPDWLDRHLNYLIRKTMVVDWQEYMADRDDWIRNE
jgi:hypothetical protein